MSHPGSPLVQIVTLGCARNDTDSEQLASRILTGGMALTDDPGEADIILVNTCGFIEAAKKDSIDLLLDLADARRPGAKIIATGCMAQRYGAELADSLPELDAVLGFSAYDDIAARLRDVLGVDETSEKASPSEGASPNIVRARLDAGPYAPLKIASGCDRRCAFCAIPAIRGAYRSRPIADIVAEARWLVGQGVREIMLVSENSTGYGKDTGDREALPHLLRELGGVEGLAWVRVSYLQPAEVTPALLDAMADVGNVVGYFDLSFQHASGPLLRRMRRFGDTESFLELLAQVRLRCPQAGVRTSALVGFPGETEDDLKELHHFLQQARADAIGVFGFSDEEGTEAHGLRGHLSPDEIDQRTRATSELADWLMESRAAERLGERVQVLVESVDDSVVGRAAHQGPEVDGTTTLIFQDHQPLPAVGDLVWAKVIETDGVDLLAACLNL